VQAVASLATETIHPKTEAAGRSQTVVRTSSSGEETTVMTHSVRWHAIQPQAGRGNTTKQSKRKQRRIGMGPTPPPRGGHYTENDGSGFGIHGFHHLIISRLACSSEEAAIHDASRSFCSSTARAAYKSTARHTAQLPTAIGLPSCHPFEGAPAPAAI